MIEPGICGDVGACVDDSGLKLIKKRLNELEEQVETMKTCIKVLSLNLDLHGCYSDMCDMVPLVNPELFNDDCYIEKPM